MVCFIYRVIYIQFGYKFKLVLAIEGLALVLKSTRLEYGYSTQKKAFWAIFELPELLGENSNGKKPIPGHGEITITTPDEKFEISKKKNSKDVQLQLSFEMEILDFWTYSDRFYKNNPDVFSKELIKQIEITAMDTIALYFVPADNSPFKGIPIKDWWNITKGKELPQKMINDFTNIENWKLADLEWIIDYHLNDGYLKYIDEEEE